MHREDALNGEFRYIGKEKQINWLEIFIAKDNEQVKKCFRFYFSNELDKLQSELKTMEKYGEMEAQNWIKTHYNK